jgi:hypothetical protein
MTNLLEAYLLMAPSAITDLKRIKMPSINRSKSDAPKLGPKASMVPGVQASPYLLLQGILIISKHDLQILYALRISFSTSTKCLVYNSSFSLLYPQYPILDGFCNLSIKRSLNLKLAKK